VIARTPYHARYSVDHVDNRTELLWIRQQHTRHAQRTGFAIRAQIGDHIDLSPLHEMAAEIIDDHRVRYSVRGKLERRQRSALVTWPGRAIDGPIEREYNGCRPQTADRPILEVCLATDDRVALVLMPGVAIGPGNGNPQFDDLSIANC